MVRIIASAGLQVYKIESGEHRLLFTEKGKYAEQRVAGFASDGGALARGLRSYFADP